MTVKTDTLAITPTVTAKQVVSAKGADISGLMLMLQQRAIEMQTLAKQIIAFHPGDSVLAAVINAPGSGGTNGVATLTGTTGTGTKFTARGTIASGALAGVVTILSAGNYTVDPTSLSAEPVTGSNLTGATLTLQMSGDLAQLNSLNAVLAELL